MSIEVHRRTLECAYLTWVFRAENDGEITKIS